MKLGTSQSDLEEHLAGQLRFRRWIPPPLRQYRILGHRKYVWDFAWPAHKLAVEVDGGTWTGGAHVRGNGYERDCEKQNLAVVAGWRTMRFTAHQVRSDMAVEMIARALGVEGRDGPPYAQPEPDVSTPGPGSHQEKERIPNGHQHPKQTASTAAGGTPT